MSEQPSKLLILWTSADREVASHMVFMYGYNGRRWGWWEESTLLVWGPSQPLLLADEELQERLTEMIDAGVHVMACKGCSDRYGISDDLAAIGVDVQYTGELLTNVLKSPEWRLLSV
jgi:hypothetical protein